MKQWRTNSECILRKTRGISSPICLHIVCMRSRYFCRLIFWCEFIEFLNHVLIQLQQEQNLPSECIKWHLCQLWCMETKSNDPKTLILTELFPIGRIVVEQSGLCSKPASNRKRKIKTSEIDDKGYCRKIEHFCKSVICPITYRLSRRSQRLIYHAFVFKIFCKWWVRMWLG